MSKEEMEYYKSEFGKLMEEYRATHEGRYPSLEETVDWKVPSFESRIITE